jgi:DNA polymerase IV
MALDFPPIYLLPTHLPLENLHELEDQIPTLTYDTSEAKIILGKVTTKQRALFEIRSRKLWIEEVIPEKKQERDGKTGRKDVPPPAKRQKVEDKPYPREVVTIDSSTESEPEMDMEHAIKSRRESQQSTQSAECSSPPAANISSPLAPASASSATTSIQCQEEIEWGDTIKVMRLAWFTDSLEAGILQPVEGYLVYEGRHVPRPEVASVEPRITKVSSKARQYFKNFLMYNSVDHKESPLPERYYVSRENGRSEDGPHTILEACGWEVMESLSSQPVLCDTINAPPPPDKL